MLHHPYLLEELANEHRNNLLKEADAYRIARQVKKERRVQASLLKPMVARLKGLLISPMRQLADQGPVFTDKAFTDG